MLMNGPASMVLTIARAEQVRDKNCGSRYVLYHVYVDGYPLCRLRYRQFSFLHQQLCRKRILSDAAVASFPTKSLLPLGDGDVEVRREALQQYLQLISQDTMLLHNHVFTGFVLSAQFESYRIDCQIDVPSCVQLEVHLADGSVIKLSITPDLHTDTVLELLARELILPVELTYHFSLFFVSYLPNEMRFLRRLSNLESPYISFQYMRTAEIYRETSSGENSFSSEHSTLRIVLLKSSWDISLESQICASDVVLNLLYAQRVREFQWRWADVDPDSRHQLSVLQNRGEKLRFIERFSTLSDYGHVHFDECFMSDGDAECHVKVSVGFCHLVIKECGERRAVGRVVHTFEMSNIRCWSLGQRSSVDEDSSGNKPTSPDNHLSFHYRDSAATMRWCTLRSHQAMFMAHCLNSLAEEIMRSRRGHAVLRPCDQPHCTSYRYMTREGQVLALNLSTITPLAATNSSNLREQPARGEDAWRKQVFRFRTLVDRLSANVDMHASENQRCDESRDVNCSLPRIKRQDVFDGIEDSDL